MTVRIHRTDALRIARAVEMLYWHGFPFWEAVVDAVNAHQKGYGNG